MEYWEYTGLECAVPEKGETNIKFTVDVPFGFDLRHKRIDYVNIIDCLYQLEVDVLRGAIIERYVNMQPWEAEEEWWVPVAECCIMVTGATWPAVYHKPTGRIRVLIMLRNDLELFDEDPRQEGRNEIAALVVNELANEETLQKALELAYGLNKKTANEGEKATGRRIEAQAQERKRERTIGRSSKGLERPAKE